MFLKAKSTKIGYNTTHDGHITFQFFSYWIRDCENAILVKKKIKICEI